MTREIFEQIVKEGFIPRTSMLTSYRKDEKKLKNLTIEQLVKYIPRVAKRNVILQKYKALIKNDKKNTPITIEVSKEEILENSVNSSKILKDSDDGPSKEPVNIKTVIETAKKTRKTKVIDKETE